MWQGMKSVMVFDPKDSQEETNRKWMEWNQHKSAVGDKYVPTAQETRKYLAVQKNEGRRYA
ncbi:hypothetical protein [Oceanobacillus sp. CF4.6]|uniref:hypothetical protein n=1 Tax=Oceanobacillus sp. CF4.6 TaxID=3373080 RepID=UPI003EE4EC7F